MICFRPRTAMLAAADGNMNSRRAFTLIELLVVLAVIGIMAALLLRGVSAAKAKAKRTVCLNNLRQINLGLRQYCDDSDDRSPAARDTEFWSGSWSNYRRLMQSYVGVRGEPSPQNKLFACPADTFYVDLSPSPVPRVSKPWLVRASLFQQTNFVYSSYAFNGGLSNAFSCYTNIIGIGGRKLSSIKEPARTVFVCEVPALFPYSWHQPGNSATFGAVTYNNGAVFFVDARNMVSFVDGHVSYTKMFWNPCPTQPGVWAITLQYDPPVGYDYKWSGD